ncbi:MAG: hypothetical protein GTN36_06215 [Candidatus Aenigmarchaeota archaeon]|nr:hypothetical protein [Candidatus Aenigmarchaeota archaeon]
MIKRAVDFLKKNGNKKTVIIFDTDGDGIGAVVILAKTFKKLFKKTPRAIPASHDLFFITKNMFQEIKNKKFDNIITVDIAVDEDPEYILKLAKKSKILIIDHHQINRNLNRIKNILHVNPSLEKIKIPPFNYCTSKIVYDICNKLTNIEDLDWLAGIGIVNDRSENKWKGFLNKIYKKHNISLSKLRLINNMITSSYHHSRTKGAKKGYKACLEASSPIDILKSRTPNSKKLKKFYNIIEEEIVLTMKDWKRNSEVIENKKLIILKLKTKFSINSPISTKISKEKPNYTVVVASKRGKMIYMSMRRQDKKVDCGKIASKLSKEFKNSSGGGHKPAAGIHIMAKDWTKFRKKMVNIL